MKQPIVVGSLLLLLAAGCGPVSDDPRQGGLVGYWHGTNSGKYEERQQQRRELLAQEQQTNQQLNQRALALHKERELQDQRLVAEQRQVVSLERKLKSLQDKVKQLRLTSAEQKSEAASLQAQIEQSRQRIERQKAEIAALDAAGGAGSDPERARVLELERDRLADEYRKLNTYYQALSNALH